MAKKIIRTSYKITVGLCIVFLLLIPFNLAEGYNITYQDIQGDVLDSEDGQNQPSGHENIDILQIISSERNSVLGTQLIFQMKVTGVITNSDEIPYSFFIIDGDETVYYITYSNGLATGVNIKDGSMDVLQASGTGTNTLEISVLLTDVGEITEYDFGAVSMEYLEAQEKYFLDSAGNSGFSSPGLDDINNYGDMPVTITSPRSGATVSHTYAITGKTSGIYDMVSVEIQMDSKSNDNWILTTTFDNWGNWSYVLDTTTLSPGKHKLHARAYNGSEYFFDMVEVYVDQENAQSPKTTGMPKISVGDRFEYTVSIEIPQVDGSNDYSSHGTTNLTIIREEEISVRGISCETFVIEMEGTQFSEFKGTTSTTVQTGFDYIRISDLANVKSEVKSITYINDGTSSHTSYSNITVVYDPPLDKYNFPISIGSTWSKPCSIYYEDEYGSETLDEIFEGPYEFEALHFETTLVPAGSFETFVLWDQDYYSQGGGIACNLEYYSPKLGFPVKTESYDSQRNLYYTMELVNYEKMEDEEDVQSNGIFGIENSNLPYLLLIIIVLILISALIGYKRRSSSENKESQSYVMVSEESSGKFQSGQSNRPQVRPLRQMGTLKKTGSLKDQQSPTKFVKCPKCSRLISYKLGIGAIQCPFCGTVQKV